MKKLSGKDLWNFVHKTSSRLKRLTEEKQTYAIAELSIEHPKSVIHLIEDELRDYKKEQSEDENDKLFFESSKENIYKNPEGYSNWSASRKKKCEKNRLDALKHLKKEDKARLKRKEFLELVKFKIMKAKKTYQKVKDTYKLVPKNFRPITHKDDSDAVDYTREVLYLFSLFVKHNVDSDIIHLSKEQQWILNEIKKGVKGRFNYLFEDKGSPKLTDRKANVNLKEASGEEPEEKKKDLKKDIIEDEIFLKKLGKGHVSKGKAILKELAKEDWRIQNDLDSIKKEALEKMGYTSGLVYDFKANRVSILAYNEAGWSKETMQHFSKAYFTKEVYPKTDIRVKIPGAVVDAVLTGKNNKKIAVEFEQNKSSNIKTENKINIITKRFDLMFIVCKESNKKKYEQFKSDTVLLVNNGEFYQYLGKLSK